eukprot:CAMPEP_0183437832 /NCGR_PEP_ID=MMETSP0370-20130417/74796_1 /TAXON_ID=268820 /ORGANISM="Peridinium aciculiferum, Strain PAER-2" /LENGTH=62 /DNA_ID=CAMNT_0025625817 /DNA_START=41 /DNA_END=225 /DNA_ORIENTATION=+
MATRAAPRALCLFGTGFLVQQRHSRAEAAAGVPQGSARRQKIRYFPPFGVGGRPGTVTEDER